MLEDLTYCVRFLLRNFDGDELKDEMCSLIEELEEFGEEFDMDEWKSRYE